jgi:hypothetical protein
MPRTADGPSRNRYSSFYCELAVVTNVNRKNWTCEVETIHSAKTHKDVQVASPYHHFAGGEGFHVLPEVGARCYVAKPVDDTPHIILCFVASPAVKAAEGDDPERSTTTPEGSNTDVSYQGNRLDLNPGDMALTGRDQNFIILRRGGVLQFGATPLAQRIVVPVRNYIHDFCENYELATPGGDVVWTVDRPELDPAGKAPASWVFHLNEFAVDKKATVRVRHLPLADAGQKKVAWEVQVAAQGIDRQTGAVSNATYTLMVLTDGTTTEFIGASRTVDVKGDDTLTIGGKQTVSVTGDYEHTAAGIKLTASKQASLVGKSVKLGDEGASEPAMLGNAFVDWAKNAIIQTPAGPGKINPISIQALQKVLSKVVFNK